MNSKQREWALQDLDKHASEFNFPVFDNAYILFAAAKMSVFSGDGSWVIAFEVLGYSTNNGSFENYLYAYGNCLSREGLIIVDIVLSEDPEFPLIDPSTQAWIADWSNWSVFLRNQRFHFQPSRTDYSTHGIIVDGEKGPGSLAEKDVLRYFIAAHGAQRLFRPREELASNLSGCSGMELLLQTCDWEHPDIAGGQLPSQSASIPSVLSVIENYSPDMFVPGKVNSHWQYWDSEEIE